MPCLVLVVHHVAPGTCFLLLCRELPHIGQVLLGQLVLDGCLDQLSHVPPLLQVSRTVFLKPSSVRSILMVSSSQRLSDLKREFGPHTTARYMTFQMNPFHVQIVLVFGGVNLETYTPRKQQLAAKLESQKPSFPIAALVSSPRKC